MTTDRPIQRLLKEMDALTIDQPKARQRIRRWCRTYKFKAHFDGPNVLVVRVEAHDPQSENRYTERIDVSAISPFASEWLRDHLNIYSEKHALLARMDEIRSQGAQES